MIKSRERTKYVPIIFLTAISKDEEYVFKGYSVGAVDYMFKPFQPEILRSKVNVFVELYSNGDASPSRNSALHESERQELELRHMRELLQSEARFREIVGSAMDAIVRSTPTARSRSSTARPSECSVRRPTMRLAARSRDSSRTA